MTEARTIRDAVEARLARRHRAERRFQLYGLGAIVLAVAFLVLLIGSILYQSVPAFTAHEVTLEVELDPALVDPRGDGSEASLRRGSYNTVIQNALQAQFPDVDERSELRELFGLYSAVNAARLLNTVVDQPELVGARYAFSFPISDDADLYLKGRTVDERRAAGDGMLTIIPSEADVTLRADSPAFQPFADAIRAEAAAWADAAEARAAASWRSAQETIDADTREVLEAEAERAGALAERLRSRLAPDQALVLDAQAPSFLVEADGGVFRVRQISADRTSALAETVIAPAGTGAAERWTAWVLETPAAARLITDRQLVWVRALADRGLIENRFNTRLFTNADSREPELAGVMGALTGSILTVLVTMLLAVPIGVGAAIYLEEFAPKNRLTQIIEVNINNLAAVPSIVFGLLGLAVFINAFGLPRSAPLVGGMVLALMTLPTVIISSRAALKAVPPSIREAALGVGASKTQAVFHHVLPLAAPGILTGSIIGLAQALGETAPLLMIGMVAFIADPPSLGFSGFTEPATVMPVQIFIWSSSAERAFEARTAAAILVLLGLMILFNAVAIYLRRRFERRW
ncbi:MAG: phosphate ABC transporter permease PstA [Alphaproteobacteria bacterium]|nr:phosphate ABC transporter permease PstA [Alphaproteobacteria bacterium]